MRLKSASVRIAKLGGVLHRVSRRWRSSRRRLTGQAGQTLAEYGMLVSMIFIAVLVTALLAFQGPIASGFEAASDCISGTCVGGG